MNKSKSPYIKYRNRLADLIAAIQVMGTYKYANRKTERWTASFGRKPLSADSWSEIFEQHPEFFRYTDGSASLMWRRAYERLFDTRTGEELNKDKFDALTTEEKEKISRAPLQSSQVEALVNSALQLHATELAHQKELRWWVPVLAGLVGVLIGALVK